MTHRSARRPFFTALTAVRARANGCHSFQAAKRAAAMASGVAPKKGGAPGMARLYITTLIGGYEG